MHTRPRSTLLAALLLVLMGAGWLTLAPTQFGGSTAFVIVNGNSMEPTLHRGDLVIVRATGNYQVGEIVTYRHPQIGPVIHRIIGRAGDQLTFKGDHNSWVDSYQPTERELIGSFWLRLPAAGRAVGWLREPLHMAIVFALVGMVTMATLTDPSDGRRRRRLLRTLASEATEARARRQPASPAPRPRPIRADRLDRHKEGMLLGLALLTFASLLLTVFSFTQPLTRSVTDQLSYQQSGEFDYTASAADVYEGGRIRAGEPVFRQLVSALEVGFSYRLAAEQARDLRGSYQLLAELSDGNGWARTIALGPATPFSGDRFSTRARLDLAQVQALIDTLKQRAGIERPQYTLALAPTVSITGTLAGQPLSERFAPRLEFRLDAHELRVLRARDTGDPLKPSQAGMITSQHSQPNTIGLAGLALPVSTARWLPLAGVLLAAAGAALFGWRATAASQADEATQIMFKYGPLLIGVRGGALATGARTVEVGSIDDLAKLAERDQLVILYEQRGASYHYYVQDAGVTYHYQARANGGELAAQLEAGAP